MLSAFQSPISLHKDKVNIPWAIISPVNSFHSNTKFLLYLNSNQPPEHYV